MLAENEIQSFIRSNYSMPILEQAHNHRGECNYRSFHFNLDLFDVMKNHSKIASIIVGSYPFFIQTVEKSIHEILT